MKICVYDFKACLGIVAILFGLGVGAFGDTKPDHRCATVLDGSCKNTGTGNCGLRLEYDNKCNPTSGADSAQCFFCNNSTTMITTKVCLYNRGGTCTTTPGISFNCAPDDNAAHVGACSNDADVIKCVCDGTVLIVGDMKCGPAKKYYGCSS